MPNKIKTQNFLSGVISDSTPATYDGGIPSSGDFSVRLSSVPTYTKGFLVLDHTSPSTRESVYFHNRVGDVIFVKAENRIDPKAHADGSPYQMNNSAELINYLSDNTDTSGYVEKTGGLTVNVWGGYVLTETGRVLVNDTSLTLPASQTSYIYLTVSNTIASTLNLSEANTGVPLATVITGSTSVSTITQEKPYIIQKRGPQGIQGPQGEQGPPPTVPELPEYTFTGGATDRSINTATATIAELFNVFNTLYEDIKAGLQGIGTQGPAGVGIPTGGTTGQLLQKASGTDYDTEWYTPSGVGDMVKATYDPTNKNQDIFAYTYSKAEANSLLSAKQDNIGYTPANDTAVVKLTGNQSVAGTKTFSDIITSLFRLTGGTPGVGKVLTSDASGNGTWETPAVQVTTGASIYRTTPYVLSTTLTAVPLDAENFDTSSFHDNAVNNTRLTIPTTGVYTVGIHCSVYSSVSGVYQAYALIRKNGTTGIAGQQIDPSGSGSGGYGNLSFSTQAQLNAGDYIEVMLSKSSGTPTMSIQNTATDFSFFIKS